MVCVPWGNLCFYTHAFYVHQYPVQMASFYHPHKLQSLEFLTVILLVTIWLKLHLKLNSSQVEHFSMETISQRLSFPIWWSQIHAILSTFEHPRLSRGGFQILTKVSPTGWPYFLPPRCNGDRFGSSMRVPIWLSLPLFLCVVPWDQLHHHSWTSLAKGIVVNIPGF